MKNISLLAWDVSPYLTTAPETFSTLACSSKEAHINAKLKIDLGAIFIIYLFFQFVAPLKNSDDLLLVLKERFFKCEL